MNTAKAWEWTRPFLLGAILPAAYWIVDDRWGPLTSGGFEKVVNASMTMAGIIVGFLASTIAILAAVPDRPFVKRVKQAGAFQGMVRYLACAIFVWLLLAALAIVHVLFDCGTSEQVFPWIATVPLYLLSTGLFMLYFAARLVYKFLRLLWTPAPEDA